MLHALKMRVATVNLCQLYVFLKYSGTSHLHKRSRSIKKINTEVLLHGRIFLFYIMAIAIYDAIKSMFVYQFI